VQVREIETGLWYWTGLHPAWTPADGGPDGWDQEVGCVYYEGPDAVVLFDPLVSAEESARFYEALDRDVERVGRPLHVLLTTESHRRSSQELAERYGGTVGERPAGVDVAVETWGETVFWLPQHAALVVGDLILGRDGGLIVPRGWIQDDYPDVVESLQPLLELPLERVLVTHGEPVLEGGRDALARALAA
jgi:glyoxylase-like metal-dependent hydrolase (beta-lactamase superfamily II)